jgi:hypothetical protein
VHDKKGFHHHHHKSTAPKGKRKRAKSSKPVEQEAEHAGDTPLDEEDVMLADQLFPRNHIFPARFHFDGCITNISSLNLFHSVTPKTFSLKTHFFSSMQEITE